MEPEINSKRLQLTNQYMYIDVSFLNDERSLSGEKQRIREKRHWWILFIPPNIFSIYRYTFCCTCTRGGVSSFYHCRWRCQILGFHAKVVFSWFFPGNVWGWKWCEKGQWTCKGLYTQILTCKYVASKWFTPPAAQICSSTLYSNMQICNTVIISNLNDKAPSCRAQNPLADSYRDVALTRFISATCPKAPVQTGPFRFFHMSPH